MSGVPAPRAFPGGQFRSLARSSPRRAPRGSTAWRAGRPRADVAAAHGSACRGRTAVGSPNASRAASGEKEAAAGTGPRSVPSGRRLGAKAYSPAGPVFPPGRRIGAPVRRLADPASGAARNLLLAVLASCRGRAPRACGVGRSTASRRPRSAKASALYRQRVEPALDLSVTSIWHRRERGPCVCHPHTTSRPRARVCKRDIEQPVVLLHPPRRPPHRAGAATRACSAQLRAGGPDQIGTVPLVWPAGSVRPPEQRALVRRQRHVVSGRITSGACKPFAPCTVITRTRSRPLRRASPPRQGAASAGSPAATAGDCAQTRARGQQFVDRFGRLRAQPRKRRAANRGSGPGLGEQRVWRTETSTLDSGEREGPRRASAHPPSSPARAQRLPQRRRSADRQIHEAVVDEPPSGLVSRKANARSSCGSSSASAAPSGPAPRAARSASADQVRPPARRSDFSARTRGAAEIVAPLPVP